MGNMSEGCGRNEALDKVVDSLYAWHQYEFVWLCTQGKSAEAMQMKQQLILEGKYYNAKDCDVCYTVARNDVYYDARLEEVTIHDHRFEYVCRLMQQAFPEDERPDIDTIKWRMANERRYHCCVITMAGYSEPVGILTYWLFDPAHDCHTDTDGTGRMIYIEHFAIGPAYRSRGYGNRTLSALLIETLKIHIACETISDGQAQTLPVVLEVEEPTTDEARRRISFYQRNGWVLWPDTGYLQPAYREGGNKVPMRLMATPNFEPSRYHMVRNLLYRYVYGEAIAF